jgi:inosine/xanthosine triphosphate pyrophosphatase family protein
MKKILIATKNKDKFAVITKILDKISKESYEYYSLYDIENLTKNDKEE